MLKLKRIEGILLFLTLLFLPTQLGKHFWPDFSYIYSLKVDYLSPTLYFWDILVMALLTVWFLGRPKINKPALNILLLFLFTQALSAVGTSNIGAGFVRLEQYLVAGSFGVFLASQDSKRISGKIFLPLAIGILGESLLAILQFIKGGTLGLWVLGERTFNLSTPGIAKFDFYGWQFLRPYGTFPHPNVLAVFMLITLILMSFWGAKRLQNLKRKDSGQARMTILSSATFLAGITIFLTMSRTAILAGLITLAVLLRRKWLIFMAVLLLILSPILFTRFSSLLSFDNLALLRREELIGNAWQMFLKSPIYGVGLNNFIPTVATSLVTGPSRFLQPVHNIFLLALSETGLIGLLGLISLIGFPILSSLPRVVARGKLQQGSINSIIKWIPAYAGMTGVKGVLLPWAVIIFLGLFDHYFLTLPQGYRLLFLVWGLTFSMLK